MLLEMVLVALLAALSVALLVEAPEQRQKVEEPPTSVVKIEVVVQLDNSLLVTESTF